MRSVFRMEDQYITMIRGDTLSFNIELYNEDGEPFKEDIDNAFFTCKYNKNINDIVFQKSLNNGIKKISDGLYIVRIAPEDTKNIKSGKYFYDLQLGKNEDVFTVLHGILEIEQDVTY